MGVGGPIPRLLAWKSGFDLAAVAAPQRVELLAALGVDALVGVRAEEVALGLGQRGRQPLRAQRVVVGQRRREAGDRDAELAGGDDDAAPAVDSRLDRAAEVRGGDQARKVRVLVKRLFDAVEEL